MIVPVLVVFLAAADAEPSALADLVAAASAALGPGARVVLERYERTPPTDERLAVVARSQGAVAAARVVWSQPDRARAAIDVYLAREDRVIHRALEFQPHDAPSERARAVGLILGSLLSAPAPPAAAAESTVAGQQLQPPPSGSLIDRPVPLDPVRPGRWALEGFAGGGLSLGGQGSGLGGGVAGRLHGTNDWGLRAGLQVRSGSVPAAQASSLTAGLSLGAFGSRRPVEAAAWDVGVRANLLLLYEALTHFSADDPAPVRQGRLLPGAAILIESHWGLTQSAGLHVAAGVETAFGTTHVKVRGVDVAELAPVRAVLESGLRVRF